MQSKRIFLLFIVIITVPIIFLASNHEIFFLATTLVITVVSIKYIFRHFSGEGLQSSETDEDLEAELEDLIDIDIKRFGTGVSVVYNMLVILFLCYCAFFLETVALKSVTSFAILLQIHFIINKTGKHTPAFNADKHKPQILLSSVLNIAVIVFAIMNKLNKLI